MVMGEVSKGAEAPMVVSLPRVRRRLRGIVRPRCVGSCILVVLGERWKGRVVFGRRGCPREQLFSSVFGGGAAGALFPGGWREGACAGYEVGGGDISDVRNVYCWGLNAG